MSNLQPRSPVTHDLKTWPDAFQPVLDGDKPWEYRKADRNYQAGDALRLREWEPGDATGQAPLGYTGRAITVTVRYILCGPAYGIPEGYCVMSIKPLQEPTAPALADLLSAARRYLELQREHGGMVMEAVDHSMNRLLTSDIAGTKPYAIDVLRLVAGAISLAGCYGYTLDQIAAGWTEWNDNRLDLENCPECGLEHERRTGCPPQDRRPESA